jgi:hypothetical protein
MKRHGNLWPAIIDFANLEQAARQAQRGKCLREGNYGARRFRVLRGGSWNNNARNCRSARRNRNNPANRNHNLGFRLALAAPSSTVYNPGRRKLISPGVSGRTVRVPAKPATVSEKQPERIVW